MRRSHAPSVVVVMAEDQDESVASEIIERLHRQGIVGRRRAAAGEVVSGVVPVMSPSSLVDAGWLAELERLRAIHLVPVVVGSIAELPKPEVLAELNWIFWDPADRDAVADKVFIGLSTDAVTRGSQRSLDTEAASWRASGYRDDALIFDVNRAKQARALVWQRNATGTADPLLERFTSASLKYAKGRRRGRIYRRSYAVVIALLVIVWPLATLLGQRDEIRSQQVSARGLDRSVMETRPDLSAILSFPASTGAMDDAYEMQLIAALDREWDGGRVAWHGAPLEYVSLFGDGGAMTADAEGGLARWNLAGAQVEVRKKVADTPMVGVWANQSGSTAVGVSQTQAYVVPLTSWDAVQIDLPQQPVDGAVSAQGAMAAVVFADVSVMRINTVDASTATVGQYEEVLDIARAGADDLSLLVRQGELLQIVDVRTGAVQAQAAIPRYELEAGGLNTIAGRVAITSPTRELLVSGLDLKLQGTGQRTDEYVRDVAVADNGFVLLAGHLSGVQAYSPEVRAVVGTPCRDSGLVGWVQLSGTSGMCSPGFLLFDLNALALVGAPPPDAKVTLSSAPSFTSENGQVTMEYSEDDERIVFTDRGANDPAKQRQGVGLPEMFPASARVTAIDSSPNQSILLGTDRGDVREVALNRGASAGEQVFVPVGQWQTPDGSAVVALGYTEDGADYYIQTAAGHWFKRPSCGLCHITEYQVDLIRAKRHNMYQDAVLEALPDGVAERFDLRPLPEMPTEGTS